MSKDKPEKRQDPLLEQSIKRILVAQILVFVSLFVVFLGYLAFTGGDGFIQSATKLGALAYGSMLAITGTILSARSLRRTVGKAGEELSQAALIPIYSGLLNKLVIVGGGIAFGLIVLDLEPLLVVTSYFIVQMSSIVSGQLKN